MKVIRIIQNEKINTILIYPKKGKEGKGRVKEKGDGINIW
jgi:hypothetical protein